MNEIAGNPAPKLDLLWADEVAELPLCDIPWYGRSVVLSSGDVQFCCFSDAILGNVNQIPLESLWNGPQMQNIRRELAQGKLPRECQNLSCPVHRDLVSGTLIPMVQRLPQEPATLQSARSQVPSASFQGCLLVAEPAVACPGQSVRLRWQLNIPWEGIVHDRYLAVRYPDGSLHFLPGDTSYPLPFRAGAQTREVESLQFELPVTEATLPGGYRVGAALFEPEASPGFAHQCYWAQTARFSVGR